MERRPDGTRKMLFWAVAFLVLAIIAAILGFGGIAAAATDTAMVLFWVFVAVFLILLLLELLRPMRGIHPPV